MPKYDYVCPVCKKEYSEVRLPIQQQHVTKCSDCNVDFSLIGEN
jgi:hypothetical protein